jgi:hypothetical protein
MKCTDCGKTKKTVQYSQSARTLVFGGWNNRPVFRCQSCETKLAKRIERMLSK